MLHNAVVLYRRTITLSYIVSTNHESRLHIPSERLLGKVAAAGGAGSAAVIDSCYAHCGMAWGSVYWNKTQVPVGSGFTFRETLRDWFFRGAAPGKG